MSFFSLKRFFILFFILFLLSSTKFTFSQIQIDDGKEPKYYEYIIQIYAPSEDAFIALQRLIKPYLVNKEWNNAIKTLQFYKTQFIPMADRIDRIISILQAPEEGIHMVNLGGNINTQAPEYGPVISPDGRKLFFTGRDREDGIGGEDIFVSYNVNGLWTISKPLAGNINTESNEYINSISADGNILVLFGNYENSLGRGDNFYVEKTPRGWSEIKTFPPPINSQYWDADAFLTADGNAILFSSERPGGIGPFHPKGDYYHGMFWGNTDIYVVLKDGDGWSKTAINLGPTINTQYTERTPFLHPDGKTLYFSSDGYPGLGKSDVFRSIRLSDSSWTDWSEPVNLGKEINTSEEDWGYKITTDGKRAYFSTVNDRGFGAEDIYYVDLPQNAKPERDVITINGKIIDEKGKPVDATIRWSDVDQQKEVGVAKTDPSTGEYFIFLPVGRYYAYYADVKGYYSPVEYLDLTNTKAAQEIKNDVTLVSVEELKNSGKSIKLENIFFDFDKYDLKEKSYEALNTLLRFMKENPELIVEINAYTDNIGSEKYNLKLSENRAGSVVSYLIQKGIDSPRLYPIGHGKDDPVASNETEEGRALNRRVEFRIRK